MPERQIKKLSNIIKTKSMIEKIINWSALTRLITGGDRNGIRSNNIPKKWHTAIDKLIYVDLPAWWERKKKEN